MFSGLVTREHTQYRCISPETGRIFDNTPAKSECQSLVQRVPKYYTREKLSNFKALPFMQYLCQTHQVPGRDASPLILHAILSISSTYILPTYLQKVPVLAKGFATLVLNISINPKQT